MEPTGYGDTEMRMRAARQGFAWAVGATLLAGSASAWAAEPGPDTLPISVIAVQTDTADDQAEALTKALRNAVRAMPGWSLGEGDFSLEVLTLSLKCSDPPDANCQSRIADQIKADRYIWAVIKKEKKSSNVTGNLYFWVRGKGTNSIPVNYSANLTEANDDALRKIATTALNELTGGPPKGSIHVKAGKVQGQVFVDGEPLGALQGGEGTFMIPSGPHKVTVKAPGHADGEAQVVVKPTGAPTEVSVNLGTVEEKTPINGKRVAGFTLLGAGVAFGVVGLVGSLKVNSVNNQYDQKDSPMYKYRQAVGPKVSSVCNLEDVKEHSEIMVARPMEVDTACNKAKTPFILQLAFYPLAAVAAGVGIFLVGTSGSGPKKPASGFTINPQVGRDGGKLDITYTW